jgi:hypothetical protein
MDSEMKDKAISIQKGEGPFDELGAIQRFQQRLRRVSIGIGNI